MSIKSFLGKQLAKLIVLQTQKWSRNPIKTQKKVLNQLIREGKETAFGSDHHFSSIKSYEDFKAKVPIRDYEGLKDYVERIQKGESNVLWKGAPLFFAKTSGTTSGAKYIPLTKVSLACQIKAARNALLNYAATSGNHQFIDGKMIFLQGSPQLNKASKVPIGRLS